MNASSVKKFFQTLSLRNVDKRMRILLFLYIFFQVIDIIFTNLVVLKGGGTEINLLAASIIYSQGLLGMILIKIAVVIPIVFFIGLIYPMLNDHQKHLTLGVYTTLVIWFSLVGIWNANQYFGWL